MSRPAQYETRSHAPVLQLNQFSLSESFCEIFIIGICNAVRAKQVELPHVVCGTLLRERAVMEGRRRRCNCSWRSERNGVGAHGLFEHHLDHDKLHSHGSQGCDMDTYRYWKYTSVLQVAMSKFNTKVQGCAKVLGVLVSYACAIMGTYHFLSYRRLRRTVSGTRPTYDANLASGAYPCRDERARRKRQITHPPLSCSKLAVYIEDSYHKI